MGFGWRTLMVLMLVALGGCATQYGENGINGGYSGKQINRTTYFIRYDAGAYANPLAGPKDLMPLWERRAEEVCEGDDYYSQVEERRYDAYGNDSVIGSPALLGYVYCNTHFIDSRQQSADEAFIAYQKLPESALQYREVSPLWGYLVNKRYDDLEAELARRVQLHREGKLSELELTNLLDTFSRLHPESPTLLSEWVEAKPQSYMALYSRAIYFHSYSWFRRGSTTWNLLTEKQKRLFFKYRELAKDDLDNVLSMNPGFCPAYSLKIGVFKGTSVDANDIPQIFERGLESCPESMGMHASYFQYLKPRWSGSKERMRAFIDDSIERDERFAALKALYLAEEGDQLLFAKEYKSALKKYDEAVELGSFSWIYQQRGYTQELLERYVESVDNYTIALSLSPYSGSAYEGLTRTLAKQGNYVGALAASIYLTTMNSQRAQYFEVQGNLFYGMRRYSDARARYRKAASLSVEKAVLLHKMKMAEFQIEVRKEQHNEPYRVPSI